MKYRSSQATIRLAFISLYFILLIPGLLLPHRLPQLNHRNLLVGSTIGILIISLELLEFFYWGYRYPSRKIPSLLFLCRVMLLFVPILMILSTLADPLFQSVKIIKIFPFSMILLTLLPFYAYFAFKKPVSLTLLVLFVLIPVGVNLIINNGFHRDGNMICFVSYRTLSIIFFYMMGWFIDKERQKEEENGKLMKKLTDSEERIRAYAERVADTVALEERTRLARDIHDSLAHALTAIKIQLSNAEAYRIVDPEKSMASVSAARESADDAIKDIRESLGRLRGSKATVSLKKDLPRLIDRLKDAGIAINYQIDGSEEGYNYSVLIGLYRLVQEGITNILRHAEAHHVTLSVHLGVENARVLLEDDGRGFHWEIQKSDQEQGAHYGLRGLIRRLELVRGTLKIDSVQGEGTRLIAEAPSDPLPLLGEDQ